MLDNIKDNGKKLQPVEMLFYRRVLRISWKEFMSNEEVLVKMGAKQTLLETIRKR